MAPFLPWMGGFPYRSSSGSSNFSASKITIIIYIGHGETTPPRSALRRRSPHSAFGYYEDVEVRNTYHFDPDYGRTARSPSYTRDRIHHAPKPTPKSTTSMMEFTRLFQREWKCISRGRWAQSRVAAFCSRSVLVFGSLFLLSSFLERKERRRIERQWAAEKEVEDWGDGFQ